jgi:nitric oxide reductase
MLCGSGSKQALHITDVQDYQLLSSSVGVRASGSSTARDAAAAQEDLLNYMMRLVDHKEMHPGRDLVSDLIR